MSYGIFSEARNPRDTRTICAGSVCHTDILPTQGAVMFFPQESKWKLAYNYPYKLKKDAKADFKRAKEIWRNGMLGYDCKHPVIIKQ